MITRREGWILATTGLLAVGAPLIASSHLQRRVAALGPALSELTGEPSSIAGVEAGLTGSVRLRGVEIGDVLRVDAIEASVAMHSLLSGDLGADEIRLERPRLRARVDGAGRSNLARILERVAARRGGRKSGGGGRRLKRIVVTEGNLILEVVGVGRIEAAGVELHPQHGGVRLVTGAVRAEGTAGPLAVTATFVRAGGDIRLPEARVERFLAVGGDLQAHAADATPRLTMHAAALGWGVWGARVLGLRGDVDDAGVPREVEVIATSGGVHVDGDRVPLAFLEPLAPRGVRLGAARASGAVTLARTAGGWSADLDADITGAILDHRAISDAAFPVDGTVRLAASSDAAFVTIDRLSLRHGALEIDGAGRVRRGGPAGLTAGELALSIAEAPCLDLVAALPAPVRGPLGALAMDGRLAASARLHFDLDAPPGEGVELAVDVANGCRVLDEPPTADVRTLAGVADQTFPDGSRVPVGPGVGDWASMASLPSYVPGAFIAAEDAAFHTHHGFDLQQIARSLEVNLRDGRFVRGGSTISQQLIKNAFLTHHRTLDRKLQEAVLTWRLEATLTKRQILERYLNIVELGPSIHGIAAAARHWFGKSPASLSVKEAAFLAAMTPEPRSMSRRLIAAGGLDPQTSDRIDVVLRHMLRAHVITDWDRSRARAAPLPLRRDALLPEPRVTLR